MKKTKKYALASMALVAVLSVGLHFGGLDLLINGQSASAQVGSGYILGPGEKMFNMNRDPWSLSYLPHPDYALPAVDMYTLVEPNKPGPMMIDFNGDGLTDMVYSSVDNSVSRNGNPLDNFAQALMLNTGNGFELTYNCYTQEDNGVIKYYGTCADI